MFVCRMGGGFVTLGFRVGCDVGCDVGCGIGSGVWSADGARVGKIDGAGLSCGVGAGKGSCATVTSSRCPASHLKAAPRHDHPSRLTALPIQPS